MAYEWHRRIEAHWVLLTVLSMVAVAIGGLVILVPPYFLQGTIQPIDGVRPWTALEQEGRDVYVREGCYTCHSQQVRPFKTETDRYGPFSMAGESIYDHPFQFGSRRTGPDLARIGGKYPNSWHWIHFRDPRQIEPRSNMPSFAFLERTPLDTSLTQRKLRVLRTLGTPYTDAEVENAVHDAETQMAQVAEALRKDGVELDAVAARSEAVALIAYLQRVGMDLGWRQRPPGVARLEEGR